MVKSAEIKAAARIINEGGLVAFPTETVYGLGANALNPVAVAKIFEVKERPSFDPLIVHIADFEQLKLLTDGADENVFRLAEKFWPGPLTVVLPKSKHVPDIVTSGLPTVGIRMPACEIALQLIRESKCPVAAPSANKFGKLSPVSAGHVRKQLHGVDYILDGGKTTVGIESTIVAIEGNVCRFLRPGFITKDDISNAMPGVFDFVLSKPDKSIAPGMLNSHYSPGKPLFILNNQEKQPDRFSGVIRHSKNSIVSFNGKVIYTSENCNMAEVAANLFSALHQMEEDESVSTIYIEPVEETGLGIAIMDRLKKAAFQYAKTS